MSISHSSALEQLKLLSENGLLNLDLFQCSICGSETTILSKEHLVILNHYLSNILWTLETANNWLNRTERTPELYGIFLQIKNIHKIAFDIYKKAEQLHQDAVDRYKRAERLHQDAPERNKKAEIIKQRKIAAQKLECFIDEYNKAEQLYYKSEEKIEKSFEDVMTEYMLSFEYITHPISITTNSNASKRKEELPEGNAPTRKKQESKKKRPRLSPRHQQITIEHIKLIVNAPFAQIYSIELNKLKEVCVNPESKEETIRSYFEEWRIKNTFGDNMDYSTLLYQLGKELTLICN